MDAGNPRTGPGTRVGHEGPLLRGRRRAGRHDARLSRWDGPGSTSWCWRSTPTSSAISVATPCIPRPSQVMDELGLIDGFLEAAASRRSRSWTASSAAPSVRIADLSRLRVKYPFIAMMPQWDFLNFLRESGKRFASLQGADERGGDRPDPARRRGDRRPRDDAGGGTIDIEADLVDRLRRPPFDGARARRPCGRGDRRADGRAVVSRRAARPTRAENLFARVDHGKMMVTFDRGDYWQCAYVIAKGNTTPVKARSLPALLDDVLRLAPILKGGIADVKSFDDVKLLTVAINRLTRWTRPGLLCIGDAAHAMSPIGGVGVNLAVQDAVATANILAAKLVQGCPSEDELDAVRRRREFPVRVTQRMQVIAQNNIISAALKPERSSRCRSRCG